MEYEGYSGTIYLCPAGSRTIGYGINLEHGIDEQEALMLLRYRLEKIEIQLSYLFPWFEAQARARKDVLIEMAFQLGVQGLREFTRTLRYIEAGNYAEASREMLKSDWARAQTPARARDLAAVMEAGHL